MRKKGSLTVEAALVVPVSFLAVILFFNLFLFLEVQVRMEKELAEICRELMPVGTILSKVTETKESGTEEKDGVEQLLRQLGTEGYLTLRIGQRLKGEKWVRLISGGTDGISFNGSSIYESGMDIRILASYSFIPENGVFRWGGIPVKQQVAARGFGGAGRVPAKQKDEEEDGDEESGVYVADNGTVFHRSQDCTYLKITVRPVSEEQLPKERNSSGGKYYPCEYCGDAPGSVYYIAEYGDRYHKTVSCRSLRRSVTEITEEEALEKGLHACSKCGGESE
ncbi:MAG: hypothetical protein J5845_02330 [Lachnospiraceae bacterium]|nr:hypothetical protein [Lachnospiraceae bacterium]